MAFLVGDVTIIKATEREYDGRKYFNCMGMTKDKDIYKFSASYDDLPKAGDVFQMEVSPSDKDLRPYVKFRKVQ